MSSPGNLTPDELLPVSNDQMLWVPALWFYLADDQLEAAFGFRMLIKSPLGAYRTCADQAQANPGLPCSSSDHTKGRAIDIDNQRTFRDRNEILFISILADNGFFNEQINGAPFPDEPWHFRNMLTDPPATAEPPALLEEEDPMSLRGLTYFKVTDSDGTNWLVPDDTDDAGRPIWRIITEDTVGSGQAEVNGVTAALGYGPATVNRADFNARADERLGTAGRSGVDLRGILIGIGIALVLGVIALALTIAHTVTNPEIPTAPAELGTGAGAVAAAVVAFVLSFRAHLSHGRRHGRRRSR